MSDAKKKLFGLFRSKSAKEKRDKEDVKTTETEPHRRRSVRDRHDTDATAEKEQRRKSTASYIRPTEWPPLGFPPNGSLSQGKAMELIATGVPVFRGCRRPIPHTSDEYYNLYAEGEGSRSLGDDRAAPFVEAFKASSFRLRGPGKSTHPWETLEQPSLEFCYGTRPGTVTLNHRVCLSSHPRPLIELRDPGVKPRDVELAVIWERLTFLETGFEEDYEDLLYKNLYKNLLRDPDKYMAPHRAMEKQIADLIVVLSRADWINFSRPENQVVAKFFARGSDKYKLFFHQLLLCMELELRIQSRHHAEWAKEQLCAQLPPSIAFGVALARRWRQCMAIERFKTGGDPEQIRFTLRCKKAQVKALRKFARAMKWPNLVNVDDVLKERDPEAQPLEDRSSDTMSYFTGLILPGPTLPWLLMNSLIDADADASSLSALTHMFPQSGFQYKSTTYWSSTSIVGKVLAPSCLEIAGWIGPARPAPDLTRVQIARIRQRRPKQRLNPSDVSSMAVRSDPLGPPEDTYPIAEYTLPPYPTTIVDFVRVEKLGLKPIPQDIRDGKPLTFDASVQFAVAGRSWPLRLSYDVDFVAAWPCRGGPHPLFFDYVFKSVDVDGILTIRDWGSLKSGTGSSSNGGTPSKHSLPSRPGTSSSLSVGDSRSKLDEEGDQSGEEDEDDIKEKVLLVNALGVSDNEVLARAWCSHWGLSAVVADVERTCSACAVREAYAACINVVILVDQQSQDDD